MVVSAARRSRVQILHLEFEWGLHVPPVSGVGLFPSLSSETVLLCVQNKKLALFSSPLERILT